MLKTYKASSQRALTLREPGPTQIFHRFGGRPAARRIFHRCGGWPAVRRRFFTDLGGGRPRGTDFFTDLEGDRPCSTDFSQIWGGPCGTDLGGGRPCGTDFSQIWGEAGRAAQIFHRFSWSLGEACGTDLSHRFEGTARHRFFEKGRPRSTDFSQILGRPRHRFYGTSRKICAAVAPQKSVKNLCRTAPPKSVKNLFRTPPPNL